MMLHSRTTPINLSGLTTNEAVRTEVQKHFADLHQLLTLPDDYSGKVWSTTFLVYNQADIVIDLASRWPV